VVNARVGKTRAPGPSDDLAFEAAVRLAGDCEHGIVGGSVVRSWAGSPGCVFCRLGNRDSWITPRYVAAAVPGPPPPPPVYAGHGVFVCEFGIVHARCRCRDCTERAVQCDIPDKHRPKPPRRRRARARSA